jgi:Flp pilus assembly protein TadD
LRRVLAYAYRKTGRYREAAVFLKALLKEKPRDTGILIEYSGCLDRAGAGSYALTVLEKARELFQNTAGESRRAGLAASTAKKQEMADIYLALGVLNYRHKKEEKAFDCFREAATINKKDPRPYEWMAAIARKNGEESGHYEKEAKNRKTSAK